MMDLQLPKNTLFRLKGNRSRYSLESLPPAVHISFKPEMIGQQFGWVKVISAEKRWNASWNHCYVLTQCIGCGAIQWQLYQICKGENQKVVKAVLSHGKFRCGWRRD